MRARLRAQQGFTLVELVAVMAILVTVVTAVTTVFVSGSRAELEANRRVQAQQEARLALDRLRREIHCGDSLTLTSASSITISLPAVCPSADGAATTVTYDLQAVGGATDRYGLRRAGELVADYVTSPDAFSYVAPTATSLGRLHVELPVDVAPGRAPQAWRLAGDVVLRNTVRR